MRESRWLVAVLWVVGLAAVVAGFVLLFENPGTPTWTEIVNRGVGGSFIVCGLIVWQRRPDSRTGLWMTATGFLYLGPQLLEEIDTSIAYTIGELFAVVWLVPFAALVLGYPTGRLTGPADRIPVAVFAFGTTVMQLVWLLFLPADAYDNVLMIWSDAGAADAIDTTQRTINSTAGAAVAVIALARWWRAAPALRRLLLPVLAGGIAAAVLAGQAYYRLLAGEWMRPTFEITSVVLFLIPLAFLVGALRAQMARAGMADLVVALHRAPDAKGLGAVLARTLRDPSLELVYWLPGFETYVDDEGKPVALPAEGSGRAATPVLHDGEPVAALVHDAALTYERELLDVVMRGRRRGARAAAAARRARVARGGARGLARADRRSG